MSAVAAALAADAVRLCLSGDTDAGVAAYRTALTAEKGPQLHVGIHVQLLKAARQDRAAGLIEQAGLAIGADVSSCALARRGDARKAADEYRALFRRGVANARMMANYMACLSLAGDSAALAEASAPDLLFRCTRFDVGEPLEPFLGRLSAALRGSTRVNRDVDQSLRKLDRIERAHRIGDPAVAALHRAVRTAVSGYLDDVRRSGHAIERWLPTAFDLISWGVLSTPQGHNVPHIHTGCWVVAVAYVEGDDPVHTGGKGGMLNVGPGEGGEPMCIGWPVRAVAPVPGTLVIMPAFYTHWTEPLSRPGRRLSVAFNVIDVVGREAENSALSALSEEL